jgi:hypothetical protein
MLRNLPSMNARCWPMERRQRLGELVPSVFSHIVQRLASNDVISQDGRLVNCGQDEEIKESDSGTVLE